MSVQYAIYISNFLCMVYNLRNYVITCLVRISGNWFAIKARPTLPTCIINHITLCVFRLAVFRTASPNLIMPTTVEENSPPMERRNSTFSYSPAEMDRFRSSVMSRSTEHIRTESIDSGIGSPVAFATPGIAVAMKRVSTLCVCACSVCSQIIGLV